MSTDALGQGGGQWPNNQREQQTWVPATAGQAMYRQSQVNRYKSAVPPMIAAQTPSPDDEALQLAERATSELTRFDAEIGHKVATFAPVLLRSESASSSQIENLTGSAQAIFSAELGLKKSRNAELIAANTKAMTAALQLAGNISSNSILEMHGVLMDNQSIHAAGRRRDEPVWIGTRSDTPIGADFVAPHHSRVPGIVDDVVAFSSRLDVPALVSVAVSHAQFETIHPFTDGNGRTGRALAQSILRFRGVTTNVAIPVSAGLLADIGGYHMALTAYRAGDVSPIVRAFANAALRAVSNTSELVEGIEAIQASWKHRLTARKGSNAWRILALVARRPVIDSATTALELGVKQPNVYPPLKTLVDAGILKSKAEHKPGPFWRSDEILEAIDGFAKRAGRRQKS
ncbi:Fic family protein [Arthrobacter sp. STN4]|uniref:Fic family protein n=1 Tax=Arthrobacter sp. STN4 TaxID=2923276 RepID=UPI00211A6F98|nr:Fic family protein [Arthrobacter sp. STN4]MCQ9163605.1 Fic family protein [Arthrobacter sp. STN4]